MIRARSAALVVVLLTVTLAACGSEGADSAAGEASATSSSKTESSPKPGSKSETKAKEGKAKKKDDGKALTQEVQKKVETNLGGKISDRCDMSDMRWHCFFDSYEPAPGDRVEVHLSFPGGFSNSEKKEFAEQARTHTFNFAGRTVTKLDAVTSFNDGVDSGTTYRRDVPMLNL